ncbi:MAG: VWA domain-containing protein [Eubacteriales bacterium]|nr:VWA domain-containing protein [Eubacteriales bacterium]
MKRKILALLLSLAMLLSIGGMVEGTLAVGISVDSTRSSVTLGEVDPVVTPTPEAEPTVEPEGTPEATPAPTVEPEATVEPTPAPTVEPEATVEPTPAPTVEPTPAPEEKAEHFEGCSDGCTAEGCACPCHAAQETPEEDFASMTDEELYAYVKQLSTDEEIEAFLKQLPEERLNALVAYAQAQEPVVVPETVVFTDAGPFMPPVTVERVLRSRYAARSAAEEPADTGNGLELSKTATANDGGTYTIRLEAYTTGTVTTTTSTVPVDIVLVLDQSGSMADDFNGNSRQYAMKQAVNNFIGAVNEKYEAEDADHRMAIVTFGDKAKTLQGWTYVDTNGKNTLQGKINNDLPASPSGATNAGAGMQQAEALMGNGYNYTGSNTTRQKVVVFFTDGVPTTNTDFDTTVATAAISSAKNLKDGGATVYTVGIFTSANPDELYGSSGFDRNSDGSVGSNWSDFSLWMIGDIKNYDIPAGNRFLNYLSSNFANSAEIGITSYKKTFLGIGYRGWEITRNFNRTASNYYLTANDLESLKYIFKTISDNIQSPDIDLGSAAVIKDIIAPSFNVPADASEIKVYTAAYQGENTWGEDTPSSLSPTVNNSSVAVTGFDFNANFITENPKEDGTRGNKLVIEFTVAPKEGFLGGNNVPTNGADSGVYNKEGTVVGLFEQPTVNVPIPDVTVTAQDKNVYLLNDVTAEQLKTGSTVNVGNVELNLGEENYGLESWQTQYVEITVKVKDKDGNVIPTDGLKNLAEDTTYTIEVTVAPKTTGSTTAKTGTSTPAAKINLFKPELTFKDSTAYYGEKVPVNNDYSNNYVAGSEKWKNGDKYSTDENVEMHGEKPDLTISYTPDEGNLENGKYTKQDVPVKATVKIGTDVVSDYTTFLHQPCNPACGWTDPTTPGDPAFLIHIKTCMLTVNKTGGNADEPYVFTVYKDGVKYSEVTVMGGSNATIFELPIGTYTIAEDIGWSWRFTGSNGSAATLSAQNPTGSITATNDMRNPYWLNGFSQVVRNIFDTNH